MTDEALLHYNPRCENPANLTDAETVLLAIGLEDDTCGG